VTYLLIVVIASVAVVANAITALAYSRSQRNMQRQHARERELLLNQLCNLAGKPWVEPPSYRMPEPDVDVERYVTSPEQLA
jgi:hypothetical protein